MTPLGPATVDAAAARRRRAGRLLIASTVVVSAALGALIVWRVPQAPAAVVLQPGWPAVVRVLAGDGIVEVRDGAIEHARFADPFGVAVSPSGEVYVADGVGAHRIRMISTAGIVSTLAGGTRGFADGRGTAAQFDTPSGLAIDAAGTVYVADTANNAIRRVTRDGQVTTLAGDGVAGYIDGPGRAARFNGPIGVAADARGRVIVADTYNDRLRAIDPDGTVSTIGVSAPPPVDGTPAAAAFDTPTGVAVDASGRILVADHGAGMLRSISPAGAVSTIDLWTIGGPVRPTGIAAAASGAIFVTDDRGRIVEVTPDGASRVVAGSSPGFADGPGAEARFRRPAGIALVAAGRLIVADAGNALVRSVDAPALVDSLLPASPLIAPRFDDEAFGWRPLLWPVAPMEGPHEVAGTLGEARGGEGERLHAGLDVHAGQGTPVLAVRDATVASPLSADGFGGLDEWLRIGPVAYIHIRAGRGMRGQMLDAARFTPSYNEAGKLSRVRVKRGARFVTGDIIGSVNAFNHVHLNVGWPGEELNPLRFRPVQFEDRVPPTITRIRVFDEHGEALAQRDKGRLLVAGRVQIVVDAWDQADGNRASRRLGLYELGYELINTDGSPVAAFGGRRDTLRFDRMNLEPDAARLIYASGSGIPFYRRGGTRFLYNVTNGFRDGRAETGVFDATQVPPGDYIVRIRAADIRGNEAVVNRDLAVSIVTAEELATITAEAARLKSRPPRASTRRDATRRD